MRVMMLGAVDSENLEQHCFSFFPTLVRWYCFFNLAPNSDLTSVPSPDRFVPTIPRVLACFPFAKKGDLHQDGPQAVPEGHATPGGDLGSDSACSVEHNRVRHAAGAGGIFHRGGIHEVKTAPLSVRIYRVRLGLMDVFARDVYRAFLYGNRGC